MSGPTPWKVSMGESEETAEVLAQYGIADIGRLCISAALGNIVQALIVGSALQLTYHYFYQPRRDTRLARLGVMWIAAIVVIHLGLCTYQNISLIKFSDQYARRLYIDWFIYLLVILVYSFVTLPIFLFFTKRAYIIWDRSKLVLWSCLAFIVPNFALNVSFVGYGLGGGVVPRTMTLDEIRDRLPAFLYGANTSKHIMQAALVCQLITALLLCYYIGYGLFRHRNGFAVMDNAISKIVWLCGESLIPLCLLSILFIIGFGFVTNSSDFHMNGLVVLRVCSQISPPIYLHGLMSSLVSRERVHNILKAEPVRALAELSPSQEKALDRNTASLAPPASHGRDGSPYSPTYRFQSSSCPQHSQAPILGYNEHHTQMLNWQIALGHSSRTRNTYGVLQTQSLYTRQSDAHRLRVASRGTVKTGGIGMDDVLADSASDKNVRLDLDDGGEDAFSDKELGMSDDGLIGPHAEATPRLSVGMVDDIHRAEMGRGAALETWKEDSRRSSFLYPMNEALARGPLPQYP